MPCSTLLRSGLGALALGLLWGCAGAPPTAGGAGSPPSQTSRPQGAPAPGPASPEALPAPGQARPPAAVPTERELLQRPDPEPRVEPVRPGGPNKPYEVSGETYQPQLGDPQVHEKGLASWYGRPFHGRRTASGEVYDMYAMTAAHKTLPIPSYVRVRNPANGREIIVRINDRGPFVAGRIVDLSYAAAVKLGTTRGVSPVELERITHEEILAGSWRRDSPGPAPSVVAVAATARDLSAPVVAGPMDARPLPVRDAPAPAAAAPTPGDAPWPAPSAAKESPAPANTPPQRPQPAFTTAARGFWVQLGAFTHSDGAANFRRRVEQQALWLAPLLAVFNDAGLHRLQAGPYPSRQDAHSAAERLRQTLSLQPLVLERR